MYIYICIHVYVCLCLFHTQMNTNLKYIYIYIYIYTQKLLVKIITSEFQTTLPHPHKKISKHTHTHTEKITVCEIWDHSNTFTQRQTYIKYQRPMKGKAGWGKHTLRKREESPLYKPISNWKSFKLQTLLSSSLIEYPIKKALCHICSLTNATIWEHTCM